MDSGAGVAEDDDELPRPVVVVAEGYDAVSEDHDEDVGDCGRGGLEGSFFCVFERGRGNEECEGGKERRKEGRKEGRTGKEGSRKTYS